MPAIAPNAPLKSLGDRIALVEDDDEVRRSLCLVLRANGFSMDTYRSGVELINSGGAADADCLLIDYKLPRLDGLEVLRNLRRDGLDTPAVLITGYFSPSLSKRARAAGYQSVIEKPVAARTLAQGLKDAIKSAPSA